MSTEFATVVSVEKGVIKVIPERKASCSGCAVQNGCGISVLSKVMGKKEAAFEVVSQIAVKKGDKVIISLKDNILLLVSVVVYILPLVLMIMGGVVGLLLGNLLSVQWQVSAWFFPTALSPETVSIIGIFAGLIGGLILSRLFFNYQSQHSRYHPVIIGKGLTGCENPDI